MEKESCIELSHWHIFFLEDYRQGHSPTTTAYSTEKETKKREIFARRGRKEFSIIFCFFLILIFLLFWENISNDLHRNSDPSLAVLSAMWNEGKSITKMVRMKMFGFYGEKLQTIHVFIYAQVKQASGTDRKMKFGKCSVSFSGRKITSSLRRTWLSVDIMLISKLLDKRLII